MTQEKPHAKDRTKDQSEPSGFIHHPPDDDEDDECNTTNPGGCGCC